MWKKQRASFVSNTCLNTQERLDRAKMTSWGVEGGRVDLQLGRTGRENSNIGQWVKTTARLEVKLWGQGVTLLTRRVLLCFVFLLLLKQILERTIYRDEIYLSS